MSWPFRDWHTHAVRGLGLAPRAFWDMPLADWLALITPIHPPMSAERLHQLIEETPDDG